MSGLHQPQRLRDISQHAVPSIKLNTTEPTTTAPATENDCEPNLTADPGVAEVVGELVVEAGALVEVLLGASDCDQPQLVLTPRAERHFRRLSYDLPGALQNSEHPSS